MNDEVKGLEQTSLSGNIGTSRDVLGFTVGGLPNGIILAEARVEGGDAYGVPLSVTFIADVPAGLNNDGLKALIEWGSGGFQPTTATFDIRRGQVVTVHGSYCRVKAFNFSVTTLRMGAFISIGRQGEALPVEVVKSGILAALGTVDFSLPNFAKNIRVFTDDPAVDDFQVDFRNGGGVINYAYHNAPGTTMPEIPLASITDVIRVTNLSGVNPIGSLVVFFGMQL